MEPDKVIYTDGRDVVVTDSTLKVRSTSYRLNGITKHFLWTIRPDRWPAILLILLGVGAVICGLFEIVPQEFTFRTSSGPINSNILAMLVGVGLFLLGALILAFSRERYAVRIATAEGEKNAVVSTKREYISQIVDAIHSAFDSRHTRNHPIITPRKPI